MNVRVIAAAVLLGLATGPAFADDYKELPAGAGRDVAVKVCSQCHSPEIAVLTGPAQVLSGAPTRLPDRSSIDVCP